MATEEERKSLEAQFLAWGAKGGLDKVGHNDPGRAAVSLTARAVAAMRAMESEKGEKALVVDPYARALAGSNVDEFIAFSKEKRPGAELFIANRTKYIDEEIEETLRTTGIQQVVIVGAGLDARAYRLQALKDSVVVEIDFPELFEYKKNALGEAPIVAKKRVEVSVNLALPTWTEEFLKTSDFDAKKPTFWLLEGLIGYLTEAEAKALLKSIVSLSASGSRLLSTFIGTNRTDANLSVLSMHKFATDDAPEVLKESGWSTASQLCGTEVAQKYYVIDTRVPGSYWFAKASLD